MAKTQPVAQPIDPASVDSQPQDEPLAPPASSKEASASLADVEKPHADEGYRTPSPPVVAVVIDEEVEPDPGDSQQVDPPGKSYTEPPAKKQKTQQKTKNYKSNYFPESIQPWKNSNNKEYFSTTGEIEAAYHEFSYIQFGGTNYNNLSWRPYSWKKN